MDNYSALSDCHSSLISASLPKGIVDKSKIVLRETNPIGGYNPYVAMSHGGNNNLPLNNLMQMDGKSLTYDSSKIDIPREIYYFDKINCNAFTRVSFSLVMV